MLGPSNSLKSLAFPSAKRGPAEFVSSLSIGGEHQNNRSAETVPVAGSSGWIRLVHRQISVQAFLRNVDESCTQRERYLREFGICKLVRSVIVGMIVRITIERGVRDHHCVVALTPERSVIAPRDAGDESKGRYCLQREIGVCSEGVRQSPHRHL